MWRVSEGVCIEQDIRMPEVDMGTELEFTAARRGRSAATGHECCSTSSGTCGPGLPAPFIAAILGGHHVVLTFVSNQYHAEQLVEAEFMVPPRLLGLGICAAL